MRETQTIEGVELVLSHPVELDVDWIGSPRLRQQLAAAWMIVNDKDLPLNPRLVGKPGIGKTTLAYAVAREMGRDVYIYQATMDTRPEDLIVTPVISQNNQLAYHASPLLTAMIRGGVCVIDEANRMTEKSWASLAPLFDYRRYVESVVAGVKIAARPEFRVCCTMNDDASTYEVPEYIQSRLQPVIEVFFPEKEAEKEILRLNVPFAPEELLEQATVFLQRAHRYDLPYTPRDGISILRYAIKKGALVERPAGEFVEEAVQGVLGPAGLEFFQGRLPTDPAAPGAGGAADGDPFFGFDDDLMDFGDEDDDEDEEWRG